MSNIYNSSSIRSGVEFIQNEDISVTPATILHGLVSHHPNPVIPSEIQQAQSAAATEIGVAGARPPSRKIIVNNIINMGFENLLKINNIKNDTLFNQIIYSPELINLLKERLGYFCFKNVISGDEILSCLMHNSYGENGPTIINMASEYEGSLDALGNLIIDLGLINDEEKKRKMKDFIIKSIEYCVMDNDKCISNNVSYINKIAKKIGVFTEDYTPYSIYKCLR